MCVCARARWDRGQSVMLVFAKSAWDAEMMDRQKKVEMEKGQRRKCLTEGSVAHLQLSEEQLAHDGKYNQSQDEQMRE